jgi:hypothetical protein
MDDNIRIIFKNWMKVVLLDFCGLCEGSFYDCCENGNRSSVSIKYVEGFEKLAEYHIFESDPASTQFVTEC